MSCQMTSTKMRNWQSSSEVHNGPYLSWYLDVVVEETRYPTFPEERVVA